MKIGAGIPLAKFSTFAQGSVRKTREADVCADLCTRWNRKSSTVRLTQTANIYYGCPLDFSMGCEKARGGVRGGAPLKNRP